MPIEITGAHPPEHRLQPGDVVMVRRQLIDKKTKKPFDWRFFALVLNIGPRQRFVQWIILDGREDREPVATRMDFSEDFQVWFLPENEWPDGIHAFRTKVILEGRFEGVDALF